jgi:hypothetical protein
MSDINKYNKIITMTKYFSVTDAIKAPIKSNTVFIIANERIKKTGDIGRYYTVFPTFKDFLNNREKYKHCHELLVDHENNKPNLAGRLVFDFDIKNNEKTGNEEQKSIRIPKKFTQQIEDTIVEVIEQYFNGVDSNKLEFVWSQSQNPKKLSRHLTVKNLYFDNWIEMSRTFYKLFCHIWDEKYTWISSADLIDFQIVRNRGSLRMVGSTKIGGHPLVFDNPNHTLTDSLIRIYLKSHREKEQLITKKNINQSVFENILYENIEEDSEQHYVISSEAKKIEQPAYNKNVYEKAFELFNTINPKTFKIGKINGIHLTLIRNKPSKCLLSGKIHEQENAFLTIIKRESEYSVNFGCFRFCHRDKHTHIGSITIDNLFIMINPKYTISRASKKKSKIFEV